MTLTSAVVGIGASAGGLEAVSKLLTHLPADTGLAFVVIQHLDPARQSMLPGILQKCTVMPVVQAADGMMLVPNKVFVIPPNAHMVVAERRLRLLKRPKAAVAMSIDCFLESLAEHRGNKAIAVILSGSASDGAQGVKAVKAEGGIVFAQDETSAAYASMPRSAAATGAVDFVMPPERIAGELAGLARHPIIASDSPASAEDAARLAEVFLILKRETGVDFSLYKPSTIRRRMLRRMMLHKAKDLRAYAAVLKREPGEAQALHDDLLIHVTQFFREAKGLEALRTKGFPRIMKGLSSDAPMRIWVPGCSSGEEAYSLAITAMDFLGERDCMNPVQVFATDISEPALEKARLGVYPVDIQKHVSPRILRRFFTKVERGFEVVRRVRDSCVFARQDLTKDPHFGNMDVISCCNVLIYLSSGAQKKILPTFHYALRPSGVLLLGSSETASDYTDLFAPADKTSQLYFKKSGESRSRLKVAAPLGAGAGESPAQSAYRKSTLRAGWTEADVEKVAERLLLSRFAPAGVIVDGELDVIHFRGPVSRFLEPATGRANLNLLRMLPALAGSVVRSLVQRARRTDATAKSEGLELSEGADGRARKASVEAIPFRMPVSGDRYYIVIFEAPDLPPAARGSAKAQRGEGLSVNRLRLELAATREHVKALSEEHEGASEELKAANEEIISSNEELQSTNEELEVAKEELQAANEELSTVNDELQARNSDLGLLNDDLLNLITTVHLPIVMVSNDLRIRRFSPMAERIMNLVPGDIGRHIGDITAKLPLPNIEEVINDVMQSVAPKELDLRDALGHTYALRIRPYRSTDNKINGAVLVFIDNDPIKRSAQGLDDISAFEAVLEIAEEPLAVLDAHLRVKAASRPMYQLFGLTESSMGLSLLECDGGRWDTPALRSRLELLASHGDSFSKVDVHVGRRKLVVSARRIKSDGGAPPLILLAVNERPGR